MVILRSKSFPKKLTKTRDNIDKKIVDFLKRKGINKISYKGYKYLYSAFVLYDIFKYETKTSLRSSQIEDYLIYSLKIGEFEHIYEKGREPKEISLKLKEVLEGEYPYLAKAMMEEHKHSIERRLKTTLVVGKYSALFCSRILNLKLTTNIEKLVISANLLDDIVEFKEFKGLKLREKIRLLFLYVNELRKNFVFIKDLGINKGMLNVFSLLFVGAFQNENIKLERKNLVVF